MHQALALRGPASLGLARSQRPRAAARPPQALRVPVRITASAARAGRQAPIAAAAQAGEQRRAPAPLAALAALHDRLVAAVRSTAKAAAVLGLAAALVLGRCDAAHAARSAGRAGGFSAPPTSSRAYSGGGGGGRSSSGYGYGGGGMSTYAPAPRVYVAPSAPLLLPPPVTYGYGGYGAGGLLVAPGAAATAVAAGPDLVDLAIVSIFLAVAASAATGALRAGGDDDDNGLAPGSRPQLTRVQVGLVSLARELKDDLDRIAARADTSGSRGLHRLLQEVVLSLLRNPSYCIYGAGSTQAPRSVAGLEAAFNSASVAERAKFEQETLVNVAGGGPRTAPLRRAPPGGGAPDELVVVTLLVATGVPVELPRRIDSVAALQDALRALAGVPPDQVLGVEVMWTPQAAGDYYTREDIITDYPHLRQLAGARRAAMASSSAAAAAAAPATATAPPSPKAARAAGDGWPQDDEVTRQVLSRLPSARDTLQAELVCAAWRAARAPLPLVQFRGHVDVDSVAWRKLQRGVGLDRLTALELSFSTSEAVADVLGVLAASAPLLTSLKMTGQAYRRSVLPAAVWTLPQLKRLALYSIAVTPPAAAGAAAVAAARLEALELLSPRSSDDLVDLAWVSRLTALVSLRVDSCNEVAKLPDLAPCSLLTELALTNCPRLEATPAGIEQLTRLAALSLDLCGRHNALPMMYGGALLVFGAHFTAERTSRRMPSVGMLAALTRLELQTHQDELPEDADWGCTALRELILHTPRLRELPEGMLEQLGQLRSLRLTECSELRGLPESLGACTALERLDLHFANYRYGYNTGAGFRGLPSSVTRLGALQELCVQGGTGPMLLPASFGAAGGLGSLTRLAIKGSGVAFLPELSGLVSLQSLVVKECSALNAAGLSGLTAVTELYIHECTKLCSQVDTRAMADLQLLTISNSPALPALPPGALAGKPQLSSVFVQDAGYYLDGLGANAWSAGGALTSLYLHGGNATNHYSSAQHGYGYHYGYHYGYGYHSQGRPTKLARLPAAAAPLTALVSLELCAFSGLQSLDGLGLGPHCGALTSIAIRNCQALTHLPAGVGQLPRLVSLVVDSCAIDGLPDLHQLGALTLLQLSNCQKIEALPHLGGGFCDGLTALRELTIDDCRRLRTIAGLGAATALRVLKLSRLTKLQGVYGNCDQVPCVSFELTKPVLVLPNALRALLPQTARWIEGVEMEEPPASEAPAPPPSEPLLDEEDDEDVPGRGPTRRVYPLKVLRREGDADELSDAAWEELVESGFEDRTPQAVVDHVSQKPASGNGADDWHVLVKWRGFAVNPTRDWLPLEVLQRLSQRVWESWLSAAARRANERVGGVLVPSPSQGAGARVTNDGELRMGGNNSPGIQVRGDDAVVATAGRIFSGVVGMSRARSGGRKFGNNEGIYVVGERGKITVTGRFDSVAGNGEYASLCGNDGTLTAEPSASADTLGDNSEIFSISGLKSSDPALGFRAEVNGGNYTTRGAQSEIVSVTAIGGSLSVNSTFESFGRKSEGISITGAGVDSTIAGNLTTHGSDSEGVSISLKAGVVGPAKFTTAISAAIDTYGPNSEGVSHTGSASTVELTGTVRTRGNNSEGISVTSFGVGTDEATTLEFGGSITTTGPDSEGVSVNGSFITARLRPGSSIGTAGPRSEGVSLLGERLDEFLLGDVTTVGANAPGLWIKATGVRVVINGTIATSGPGSPAIRVVGGAGDITITCSPDAVLSSAGPVFSNPQNVPVQSNCPNITA
ncbi:popC [Scenedesmus sp. PABB004]|nr:popC [Scenedesmus sp. PABB004]